MMNMEVWDVLVDYFPIFFFRHGFPDAWTIRFFIWQVLWWASTNEVPVDVMEFLESLGYAHARNPTNLLIYLPF